jgi:hypothetical protein
MDQKPVRHAEHTFCMHEDSQVICDEQHDPPHSDWHCAVHVAGTSSTSLKLGQYGFGSHAEMH